MNYTRAHMENACCLWEAMMDMKKGHPDLDRAFSLHGYGQMRQFAIDLAVECEEEWNELTEDARDDIGAFDWEFCPSVIDRVDWTQSPPVTPNGPLGSSRLPSQSRGTP